MVPALFVDTKTVILFLYVVNPVEINSLNYIPTGRESACACFAVSFSFLQIYSSHFFWCRILRVLHIDLCLVVFSRESGEGMPTAGAS